MSPTPERWAEVQRLFGLARELPAAEREAFVRAQAGADAELAAEVLRLLRTEPEPSFLAPPEPPPFPLPRRLGDFELLDEIGRGRFGVVYRARQLSLGRIVAVKVLMPSVTLTPRDIERFCREPRSVARLQHPNIVQVLMVGEEHGTRYFAMDLIHGPNLADEVKRLRAEHGIQEGSGGRLPSSRAGTYFRAVAELVRQAADGLAYAHQHGVVHRDVKPSNLILDAEGHVRIVDFGLARDEELGTITKSDVFAGTPHYMSPEQASGWFHRVDQRTDVYSLGVVLYELLTLRRPFEGATTLEILRNIREREAPRIRALNPRVPRDLEVICNKAMAKDKRDRYASAADLRDDLARFLAHQAILARSPSALQRIQRRIVRHRLVLSAGGLALVLGSAGGFELSRRIEAAQSVERAQRVEDVLAEGPLRELPAARQGEWVALVRSLEDAEELPAGALITLRRARGALDELRIALLSEVDGDLRTAETARSSSLREYHRLRALQNLLHASHLFPDDQEVQSRATIEAAYPRVSVKAVEADGTPTPADVLVREVDVFTSAVGPASVLGRAPLEDVPLLPGYYRIVVRFDRGGFRELPADPGIGAQRIALAATRRADEERVGEGMVPFEASDYTFPEARGSPFAGKTVRLDGFHLDATEVSNGEYRRFLDANPDRALPRAWLEFGNDARHDDLPVTGIPFEDVLAYAHWAGKRLPTAAEWQRAFGGLESRPFPYTADPGASPRGNVGGPDPYPTNLRQRWDRYLQSAAPVRSHPEARSPEGLFHLYGNVAEWTESVMCDRVDGELVPRFGDRIFYGGAWNALPAQARSPGYEGVGSDYGLTALGFRCAKSERP